MKNLLALLLALLVALPSGASAARGWTTAEISTSSHCKDLPARLVEPCLAHKGKTEPFRYVEVSASEACAILVDTAARTVCRDEVQRGLPFGAIPSEVGSPESPASVGLGNFEERTALASERTAKASERTALIVTIQFVAALAASTILLIVTLRD
jgi:hypothetical protein